MYPSAAGTVLVVDDELAHQRILAQILGGDGHLVLRAASGAAALELARATPPELVILDVGLPDMSGHALCRRLREEPGLLGTPIIFVSAAHDSSSKLAAFVEGAVDYIDKPFHGAEVLARVRAHIALHRLRLSVDERTAELQRANERLARAAAAKDASLAGVSHELRAPLSAILGLAQLVGDGAYGPLGDQQRDALRTIAASGRHLLSLIDDLLDLAKIEAGREELDLEPVDPAEPCAAALELVRPGAHAAGVALAVSLAPGLPALSADRRRVTQILLNLLANALRFTPRGGRIGLELAGAPGGEGARFSVWDTGPGVDPARMGGLFRAFAQLEGGQRRGGTGLGLALVARLVRLHGGSVAMAPGDDEGSRFSVTLPLRPPAPCDEPAVGPGAPLALVVDDYGPTAEELAGWLRRAGWACVTAPGVAEAAALAAAGRPDLAVVALPATDYQGEESLPWLRAGPLGAAPLLAIGTVLLPDSRERALGAGADAFLPRPLTPADLAGALGRLGVAVGAP